MSDFSRTCFLAAAALALTCVSGAVIAAQETPPTAEQVFKNVQVLSGIPVDTFFDTMGMFANAMGNDCTFCHSPKAALDRQAFAEPTPRIARARQMIAMMNAINKSYFGGQARVTCFTCHGGNQSPRSDPNLALQYSPPVDDPNARDFRADPKLSADAVFDRYLQVIARNASPTALTSFVATGTYSGFDTAFQAVPVEIYAAAPDRYSTVVHMSGGNSVRTFSAGTGWLAGPDTPVPIVTLTSGNLDRLRLEALASFPAGLRRAFSQWRVGRAVVGDQEGIVVQGLAGGERVANFYFDSSGLLVRIVRWTQTPAGFVPTQIEYADYREVAGIRIPFRRVVTQTYMQATIELDRVQPNVSIESSRFVRPAPYTTR